MMHQIEEGTFEEISSFQNLYDLYLKVRKGKRGRYDVGLYTYNLERNLIETEKELRDETYEVGEYHRFS